jgi:hypothetical protein
LVRVPGSAKGGAMGTRGVHDTRVALGRSTDASTNVESTVDVPGHKHS